jgi:flagellar hook-basal body complex protein FliE
MNPLSAIRAAFPNLASMQALRPDAANAAAVVRPGEMGDVSPALPPATSPANRAGDGSFSTVLGRMVAEVSQKQNIAAQTVAGLQSGQAVSLHQAMISMEEANVSFTLMAEVRNKLLDSYQELMRMQV